jgi:hypothetical protein
MSLLPYQERVLEEKAELDARLIKLIDFITSPNFTVMVQAEERERLTRQYTLMRQLSSVLNERIQAFNA